MGRYRYGRNYTNTVRSTRIAEQERDDLEEDFKDLLDRRLQIHKLNISFTDVYRNAMAPEVEQAFEVILRHGFWKMAVNKSSRHLSLHLLSDKQVNELFSTGVMDSMAELWLPYSSSKIQIPAVYLQGRDSRFITENNPAFKPMMEYAVAVTTVREENRKAVSGIRKLLHECNTWGQVLRLWPQFGNYIIHEGKKKRVLKQSKKSPLPPHLDADDFDQIEANIKFAEQLLIQAILLPEDGKVCPIRVGNG